MPLTNGERITILRDRDGDLCGPHGGGCGLRMNFDLPRGHYRAVTIDHIVPKAAGGSNRLINLQLMHYWPCNARKGATYQGVDYGQGRQALSSSETELAERQDQEAV
jgi:hypothetical protein